MPEARTERLINASVGTVFRTIADIETYRQAIPGIVDVEFLSDVRVGVGARFRETREMKGRRAKVVLEITEYVENERVRFVSDAGGTVWDSIFTTEPAGAATHLAMHMDARPHQFLARLITPMIMGGVRKAIEADMDAVKDYCEQRALSGG
ncbi:MAG: SRPBCC family protein [Pseudomonadota bacterium]